MRSPFSWVRYPLSAFSILQPRLVQHRFVTPARLIVRHERLEAQEQKIRILERKLELNVAPSLSILAEPPVTVVDKVVLRRGTRELATEYLQHLYSPEAQDLIARHYYRPVDPRVAAKHEQRFPKLNLVTIKDFGGWAKAQKVHFADKGICDQIYAPK